MAESKQDGPTGSGDHPPEEPRTLEYARPDLPPKSILGHKVSRATSVAVYEQLAVFFLYAAALDGGATARRCMAVAVIFWVFWVLIIVRRGTEFTLTDLLYTYLGYPILLVAVEVGNAYR